MKNLCVATLIASSLFTLSAHADEAQQHWYGGLGLAAVNFSANKSSFPSLTHNDSIESQSQNLNLFLGYQFDPMLGLELDYLSGGSVSSKNLGKTSKLFNVELTTLTSVIGASINDNVRIFAKLGGTMWSFASQQSAEMNNGFGPTIGVGADINFYGNSDRKLRVEYNSYHLDNVFVKKANSVSINAVFLLP